MGLGPSRDKAETDLSVSPGPLGADHLVGMNTNFHSRQNWIELLPFPLTLRCEYEQTTEFLWIYRSKCEVGIIKLLNGNNVWKRWRLREAKQLHEVTWLVDGRAGIGTIY